MPTFEIPLFVPAVEVVAGLDSVFDSVLAVVDSGVGVGFAVTVPGFGLLVAKIAMRAITATAAIPPISLKFGFLPPRGFAADISGTISGSDTRPRSQLE